MLRIENCFVIEWKGPFYDIDQIRDEEFENSFYLITGKVPYQRTKSCIQYCGISKKRLVFKRLMDKDHTHNFINRDKQIWIGQFSNKNNNLDRHIELAETIIIYYWKPELNENKIEKPPKLPIGIINRWLTTSGNYRKNIKYPAQQLDDVIMYDGENFWATKKLFKVFR